MQDRLKRKYYDKETKAIYTVKPITNTCENGKDITFYGILVSGLGQVSEYEADEKYSERFIKLFCIGLKDKNGKLIFEGDIVKKKGNKFFSTIVFNHDSSALMYSDEQGIHFFYHRTAEKLEVLGNIYQNPELLKEVQECS